MQLKVIKCFVKWSFQDKVRLDLVFACSKKLFVPASKDRNQHQSAKFQSRLFRSTLQLGKLSDPSTSSARPSTSIRTHEFPSHLLPWGLRTKVGPKLHFSYTYTSRTRIKNGKNTFEVLDKRPLCSIFEFFFWQPLCLVCQQDKRDEALLKIRRQFILQIFLPCSAVHLCSRVR